MKAYTERVFGNVEGEDVLAYRFGQTVATNLRL